DLLHPAQVVPLRVRLAAGDAGVHSVLLDREDALRGQLAYLVTDCLNPVAVSAATASPQTLWTAWAQGPAHQLVLACCTTKTPRWSVVANDKSTPMGDHCQITWRLLGDPLEQQELLA